MNIYYVYAYLRAKDSITAKAGTPYYIGKGKGSRAFRKHRHIPVPIDKSNIVMLESNLSEIGALAIERRMIQWHGRKNLGTGILLNRTDGGDGISGAVGISRSDEFKEKIRKARTGVQHSAETKRIIGEKSKKKIYSDEYRAKLSTTSTGRTHSAESKEKMAQKARDRWQEITPEDRTKITANGAAKSALIRQTKSKY